MNARFFSSDPHSGSRRQLEALLQNGTDQLAICCAYCTAAGVAFLTPHAARLRSSGSFVVVSWDKPTDFAALDKLHALIPGHLYVHYGNSTPVERKVGNSKMHSKVFFARSGSNCQLWTGSHNLTASALLGANCEGAVLLEGQLGEPAFTDALAHLIACRDEAHVYQPGMKGPDDFPAEKEPTLIIHAEGTGSPPPWHLYLRSQGTHLDRFLALPAGLRLYLYHPGSLAAGWQRSLPHTAYSGSLTGVNLTPNHPSYAGAQANWPTAQFAVDVGFTGSPPVFGPNSSDPRGVTTQALFAIDGVAPLDEVWLQKKPSAKLTAVAGHEFTRTVEDDDLLSFFTPASRGFFRELVFRTIERYEPTYEVSKEDIRDRDLERLSSNVGVQARPRGPEGYLADEYESRPPFVYRANFRL